MKLSKSAITNALKSGINVIFTFTGLASVGYGAWVVYPPSAFVVVGVALIWMGLPDR